MRTTLMAIVAALAMTLAGPALADSADTPEILVSAPDAAITLVADGGGFVASFLA